MDTFTAFSTAPQSIPGGGGSRPTSTHSNLLAFGTSTADTNRSAAQQQQQQRLPGSGSGVGSLQPTTMLFSTSAVAMPNHNSNLNPSHLGNQFGTFHLSTTTAETPADQFDDKAIESITQTLSILQTIAEGKHLVPWDELLDPATPQASAREVTTALGKVPIVSRKEAIQSVARGITSPQHLAIVNYLEEPYKNEVRDLVLQDLLGQLTRTGSEPMPVYAEMLAELARLNLVRLGGVVVAIEQFLSQPDKRRAGLAVLGRMAENSGNKENFVRAIQSAKKVEPLLGELYKDPQFEYDVVAITRLLGSSNNSSSNSNGSDRAASAAFGAGGSGTAAAADGSGGGGGATYSGLMAASLQCHGVINTDTKAPVVSLQYFRSRDELVSGHGDGTVVVWGTPNASNGEVAPKLVLDLPNECIPVGMSGPIKGQYLAVAGMPCPLMGSPYRSFVDARKGANGGGNSRMPAPASGAHPVIRVLNCHETTGNWTSGETIVLPVSTTLTAIAALSSGVICVAESVPSTSGGGGANNNNSKGGGGGALQHDLRFHSAKTGQHLHTISHAHSDYTTVLSASEDNELVFFSGSRDRTIKLWDSRMSGGGAPGASGSGGGSSPLFTLDTSTTHHDTISAIYPFRNFVFTGALDGSMSIWDTRRLTSPVASRSFVSAVLDIAALEGGRTAVSTARGLHLVSLETMSAIDVRPNEAYTQLRCNDNGHVLFAAGQEGIALFSLRK